MTNKELSIILRLKDEATKRLEGLQGTLYRLKNSFKQNWLTITASITGAILLIKKTFEQIQFGAKIEQQSRAFDDLARSYGANSKKILRDMREGSEGALTTMELMNKASKAMTLGLNPEKFKQLMEISRASARAMGEDINYMFDSIVIGIGRQSKLILDNLGIVVSSNQAYENYATKLNKTVDQLTDAEKKQAFFNEVLERGKDITSRVNTSYRSNAENLQIISASLVEAKNEILLFITQSSDLTQVANKFRAIAESLSYFRKGLLISKMEKLQEKIKNLVAPTNIFTKSINNFFDAVGSRNKKKLEELQKELANTVIAMKKMDIYVDESVLNLLSRQGRSQVGDVVKQISEDMNRETPKIDKVLIEWEKIWKTYYDNLPQIQLENLKKMRQQYIEHGADLANVDRWYADQKEQIMSSMRKTTEKEFVVMEEVAKQSARNMQNAFSQFFFKAFTGELRSIKEVFSDFGRTMLQMISNIMAKIVLMKMFSAMAGAGGTFFGVPVGQLFHQGGIVKKYHRGGIIKAHNGLAPDEVPIIAQTGEGVLSRRGMRAIGGSNRLRSLNEGEPEDKGNVSITINQVIQAWDAQDVWRNRKALSNAIAEDIYANGKIRSVIRSFA